MKVVLWLVFGLIKLENSVLSRMCGNDQGIACDLSQCVLQQQDLVIEIWDTFSRIASLNITSLLDLNCEPNLHANGVTNNFGDCGVGSNIECTNNCKLRCLLKSIACSEVLVDTPSICRENPSKIKQLLEFAVSCCNPQGYSCAHNGPQCTIVFAEEKSTSEGDNMGTSGTASGSSTVAIVFGVIGGLLVLVLAALLVLQIIRMFRKKKNNHQVISGTGGMDNATLENTLYITRSPLKGQPSPHGPEAPLHPQQPSPYETPAAATAGVYSVLEPPDEKYSSRQPGGATNNLNLYTTVEQHIYEDADRYVSSPESGIVNADYEVSLKSATKSPQSADGDDYANPDDALFDEKKNDTQPNPIKSAGGKKCGRVDRAPISTQYQPSDDNDYTIPDDAIFEEVTQPAENQESDEGVLNPLYHDLGKNVKWTEPINDTSRTGVSKAKPVTVESTMYEPAVSAPVPATADSDLEPDSNTPVETENTSTHQEAHSSGSNASSMETQSSKEPHRRPEEEPRCGQQ